MFHPTVSVTSLGGIESKTHSTSIGGSCHLFTFERKDQILQILCDAGAGVGATNPDNTLQLQINLVKNTKIDAATLSHLHYDHVGNLPVLVKHGLHCPIYCSQISAQLIAVILNDALSILKKEINLVEEKNKRLGRKLNNALSIVSHVDKNHVKSLGYSDSKINNAKEIVDRYKLTKNSDIKQYMSECTELPYDENDIMQLLSQIRPVPYSEYFWIENKVLGAKFYEAGHVAGAHQTIFDFHYDKYNYSKNFGVYFSGDLGRSNDNILLESPVIPQEKINLGLIESTYGGREHANRNYELGLLVKELTDRKNMAIIPAFSLQRMQEIVHILVQELVEGTITLGADEYIYVDSKLGFAISQILLGTNSKKYKALLHEKVKFITTKEQQKAILSKKSKSIVVAGGGMAQGGPSVTYITELGKYADVKIIFVGYQAIGTLGRQILDQSSNSRIFDVEGEDETSATIRAKVVQLKSFSGHASHSELVNHLEEMKLHKDNHLLLVHGGVTERSDLAKGIKANGYIPGKVAVPELYKTYTVDCDTKKQIS